MVKENLNIGLIGYKFMGRAHSNAYISAPKFFKLPIDLKMHTVCGRNDIELLKMARTWGWRNHVTDYLKVIENEEINFIDICVPHYLHYPICMKAAEKKKIVACEKPLALNLREAKEIAKVFKENRIPNFVWFNYRRAPAVQLAKKIIDDGRLGNIFHIRAVYLQDWAIDPNIPINWKFVRKFSGSGANASINSHLIDLARFLVGEFDIVTGYTNTFIKERFVENEGDLNESKKKIKKKENVDVDDAAIFLAKFKSGALGTFEATRFAKGRKNFNQIEINGSKGSIIWNLENLNELHFFDGEKPKNEQGFSRILVTEKEHPFIEGFWPPGHIIGYEHTFINTLKDIVDNLAGKTKKFSPDFDDGVKCQEVLDAVLLSSKERCWISMSEFGK